MSARLRSAPGGWCGGVRPHLALIAVAAVLVAVARSRHLDDQEAWRVAIDAAATTEARIGAAHRLACRATERSPAVGEELAATFLASSDERLREFALTSALCRHHGGDPGAAPALQRDYVARHAAPPTSPHALRAVLLYMRKVGGVPVGGQGRLTWTEVGWFLDSLAGRPLPPPETLLAHLRARIETGWEVQRRREDEER